jgi:hypothetical protein
MRYLTLVCMAFFVSTNFMMADSDNSTDPVQELVQEMIAIVPCCEKLSLEEMKALRVQLLTKHKDKTVGTFMTALEKSDIINRFLFYKTDIALQSAHILQADYNLGKKYWMGKHFSIKTAMASGILKRDV